MHAGTIIAGVAAVLLLAYPKLAELFKRAVAKKPNIVIVDGIAGPPNPGYHKWDAVELDALKYAVSKLPQATTIGEFAEAVAIGEDYRDTIVALLSKGVAK
jgi:hypothetical protein